MKLGSLFDGSGGFPLAGMLCGVEPVWASEVEPYPIAVTRSRFPNMKHLGNVTEVCGGRIAPVDIITFGSPCQDLSVAGKRAGLKHESNGDEETTRSGLFMEAVRIIKEMREATNGEYPTFAVWENVPGAFSSNKGEDFRTVLEELIKIVEPTAVMPAVPKNGWPYADSYCGDGWSLAYRVFDAQYWGVPQRRRRIYLVLDLRGQRAGKVSFEREGLRGHFAESGTPWKAVAGDAADRTGADDCGGTGFGVGEAGDHQFTISAGHEHAVAYTLKIRSGCEGDGKGALIQENKSATLATNNDQYLFQPRVLEAAGFKAGQGAQARSIGWENGKCPTLAAEAGGNSVPSVCIKECLPFDTTQVTSPQNGCNPKWGDPCHPLAAQGHPPTVICKCYDARENGDGQTVSTLTGDHENRITDYTSVVCEPALAYTMQAFGSYKDCGVGIYLKACGYKVAPDLVIESAGIDCRNFTEYPELYPTLQAKPNGGQSLNFSGAVRVQHIVRRLTPTECACLQGFPDGWGYPDHKDDFTNDEYRFWLDIRNTHAAINGKPQKEYTRVQMLTWYNKLHTDSSEYKMWGNGISLPTALYVMQGIQAALKDGANSREALNTAEVM